jgi:hypothetical protein
MTSETYPIHMKTLPDRFCGCFLLMVASVAVLSAADLNIAGAKDEAGASTILCDWVTGIGYSANLSETKKTVYIKDEYNYALVIKSAQSGLDRILIYNTFAGTPANASSEELHGIVRAINLEKNVCTAFVDKKGNLVFRYVLGFEDRLSPALFRHQIDHVKSTSEFILKDFADRLAPYYK